MMETVEARPNYIVGAVRYSLDHGLAEIEPTPESQSRFGALVDKLAEGSVWTSGGCSSWYLDATGRKSNLWPGSTATFRLKALRFRPEDHLHPHKSWEFAA
ncbi:hypothetical protein [Rhodococcus tibetensis]|uniref:Uncharacterized protein n=1 Tax=Rhodococcus tibetensis TaxID=2965064 RepID=A0ABT1QHV2_9NOCA|nr:hypothetical protein [Rhodococcus sp. FXJ9.536]MCQ4121866.1 hypothetical protein [Rhodococcus sp. FXJ9.536]